ncbi:E2F/DP family winged-helix DNA-binding domain-containing protein [Tribonema minus]|uniref:E2F/DP family winged-helix DNA-binding domain-containing protein n=1 Tax=Tribonema minus TaxID=303371 RepID=A0A835ZFL2_9STRA|nr:E2F/DP family winged-helix DNA-binding domain-containing protein [Tribonema minus]
MPYVGPTKPKPAKAPGGRFDNSLNVLTKRFLDLIHRYPSKQLDLNAAAIELNVMKRRIYDITNVLEGIRLVRKISKNNIQWLGKDGAVTPEDQERIQALTHAHADADHELTELDNLHLYVRRLTEEAAVDLAVKKQDVLELERPHGNVVIAIRAPPGTSLVVPTPEDIADSMGRPRYEMHLRSPAGPIEVSLLTHADDAEDAAAAAAGAASDAQQAGAGGEASGGSEWPANGGHLLNGGGAAGGGGGEGGGASRKRGAPDQPTQAEAAAAAMGPADATAVVAVAIRMLS